MTDLTMSPPVSLVSPKGFHATGVHAGLKRKRKDLALLVCEHLASAAAVYTTNQFQAAPIQVTKQTLQASSGKIRAVLVNSGNANACTGDQGLTDAYAMRAKAAAHLGIEEDEVAIASTGVIGQLLPMDTLLAGIELLAPESDAAQAGAFAEAILTTDTGVKTTGVRYADGDT
ncbi:bifunctional ornithine acetyltransferase/N-acetylglutamate synthase, partial [Exiguobacterium himgiriensis]